MFKQASSVGSFSTSRRACVHFSAWRKIKKNTTHNMHLKSRLCASYAVIVQRYQVMMFNTIRRKWRGRGSVVYGQPQHHAVQQTENTVSQQGALLQGLFTLTYKIFSLFSGLLLDV